MATHKTGMFTEINDDFFYYLTPFDTLVCILGAITMVGIFHFLLPHEPQKVQAGVQQVSTDVTRIYLIHWFFVCYLVGGLLDGVLGLTISEPVLLLIALAILIVSAWLARRKPFSLIKI